MSTFRLSGCLTWGACTARDEFVPGTNASLRALLNSSCLDSRAVSIAPGHAMDGPAADLENSSKNESDDRAVHDADRQSLEGGGYSSTSYFGSPSSGTSTPMRAVNTLIEGCVGQNLEIPLGLDLGLGDILEKTPDVVPAHDTQAMAIASMEADPNSPCEEPLACRPLKENTAVINGGVGELLECLETDENSTTNAQPAPPAATDLIVSTVAEITAEEKQSSPKTRNEFPHNWSLLEACGITPIASHEQRQLPIAPDVPPIATGSSSNSSHKESFAQAAAPLLLDAVVPEPMPAVEQPKTLEPEVEIVTPSPTVLSVNLDRDAVPILNQKPSLTEITGFNLMEKFGSMVGEMEQFAKFVQDAKAIADQMETSGLFDSIRRLVDSHGAMIKGKAPEEVRKEGGGVEVAVLQVEKAQEDMLMKDFQCVASSHAIGASMQEGKTSIKEGKMKADTSIRDSTTTEVANCKNAPVVPPPKAPVSVTAPGEDTGWEIPAILTSSTTDKATSAPRVSIPQQVTTPVCSQENSTPEKELSTVVPMTSGVHSGRKSPASTCGKSDGVENVQLNIADQKNNSFETPSKPDPPHPPGINPPQKRLTVAEALAINSTAWNEAAGSPSKGGATVDQPPKRVNVVGGRGPPPSWAGNRSTFKPPQGRNTCLNDSWGGSRNGFSGDRDGDWTGMGWDQNKQPRDQTWDSGWDNSSEKSSSHGAREGDTNNSRNWNDSRSTGEADFNHSNHSGHNRGAVRSQWGGGGDGNYERRSGFNNGMGDRNRQSGWGDRGNRGNGWGDRSQGRGYSARQHSNSDGWGSWEPLEE